ncbi:hypothetical protein QYE76_049196 [Lolium multiflorum]|uniref:CCHC-type domain-containing protein n=1 Tax=Lolium multiflorum TaxID=4521 RepID=A0AAD8SP60_LOLMU|nr:hypothetical protein QYE76_049196 [Lolium multiflorum]
MIREGESIADAYGRLGALRVKVKGLGCEKYNDGFEMNEEFIKSKVIAMIAVKQKDTNLALNLQILTKQADLNADDLVSYVAANDNMAKAGEKLMAMNRADGSSHNLALKARADQEREEAYELEEVEMTSTSDMQIDVAFLVKKYVNKYQPSSKEKKRTCYNCDEDSHFANECPYVKRVDKPKKTQRCQAKIEAKSKSMNDTRRTREELLLGLSTLLMKREKMRKRRLEWLANKLVKDELKKLGENHDLLQETYKKALGSLNDPITKNVASSSTSFPYDHAELVEEHVRLKEELSLYVETNVYLESLVTKYGLNYYPNDSACEQATILEENARLTKELAKFTTAKNKMGLDDLLSKQRSNNQKFGLGYAPKPRKKNNYKKEKPAQEKNKKITSDGKASKGKATSGDRTGSNNHYALFVDYYGDVYVEYVGPCNGYAYREY